MTLPKKTFAESLELLVTSCFKTRSKEKLIFWILVTCCEYGEEMPLGYKAKVSVDNKKDPSVRIGLKVTSSF